MRVAATTILTLLAWAAPAGAAPVLEPLKPCYVSVDQQRREPVDLHARGFAASSTVDVAVNGVNQTPAGVETDALGNIDGPGIVAPFQPTGIGIFTVTLTQRDSPQNTVSGAAKVVALDVTLQPKRAKPSRRVHYRGRGFTAKRPVFAHYVFGGAVRKTVRLGRPHGDCGTFSARARQIPIRRPRTGVWTVQVDQQRRYRREDAPIYVLLSITVAKVPAGR